MSPERRRWALLTRLGLRARVTATFGLGALLLSVCIGTATYLTTRHFLVGERENAALHVSFVNAQTVRDGLYAKDPAKTVLASTAGTAGSYSVLNVNGSWYDSALAIGRSKLPTALRAMVTSGTPATQTFAVTGTPYIAVGIPITKPRANYYELFNVGDLTHTLQLLALVLFGAGLVTTALGAVVGRWASGRTLRPLTGVSRAAMAIASGRLATRVPEAAEDPDLAGLTSAFNRMVDELQQRIEREKRFTSDVSHELRSPLTTLSASLEVLEAHAAELGPSGRTALGLLSADLRRFQRMVDDLLEISRTDSGSAEAVLEEVEAGELVRRSVAAASRTSGNPEPHVEIDDEVSHLHLMVDKRRFERIVGNLLDNAALYGGGATRVVVAATDGDGRPLVQVSVDDEGPGIAPEERAKVFERFYRGLASGRRGAGTGTGLGLALVAQHARLLGGRVWADTSPGGGARFTVELPAEQRTDDRVDA